MKYFLAFPANEGDGLFEFKNECLKEARDDDDDIVCFAAGVSYSGYCIDILNAIQIHVRSLGTKFEYELYEVGDNSYGVYDEEKGQWTGLVGDVVRGKGEHECFT